MKKILLFLLPLLMLSAMAVSASAAEYVYDHANILTESEEAYLNSLAQKESEKHGISIVILTENGIGGADPMLYAADFYDYGGFADNGVILFLEMGERDWRLVNTGVMMNIIGDYELDYIEENAVGWFSAGDYETGFEQYIIISSALWDNYQNGDFTGEHILPDYEPYRQDMPLAKELGAPYYAVAFGISLLIAFLVCSGFKRQLNSAVRKTGAADYFSSDSANVTHSADRFLYSRVSKIRKSDDSSSSRSGGGTRSFSGSSGRSHSGGGGKF